MNTTVAGVREATGEHYVYPAGEIVEVSAKEGKDLCSRPADAPRATAIAQKPAARRETR